MLSAVNIFKEISSRPKYFLIFLFSFVLLFIFIIWLPNLHLVASILIAKNLGIYEKINFVVGSILAFKTSLDWFSRIFIIIISFLFAVNITLTVYYIKYRISLNTTGLGVVGTVGSLLGIGCASCGSVILTQLFGFSSLGFINKLPLGGNEISIIGIFILIISAYITIKKIQDPTNCKIPIR